MEQVVGEPVAEIWLGGRADSGSDRVVLERPNLATALTQQVDSTKSLLSIVLENAPRWGRGVPLKREIRSNLVPRRGKNARLVSLLGNVERSILLIDTRTQSNSSRLFRVIGREPIIQLRFSFSFFFFLDKFGHPRPRWLDVD